MQLAARGRVWTGEDAQRLGLVDKLGCVPRCDSSRSRERSGARSGLQTAVGLMEEELETKSASAPQQGAQLRAEHWLVAAQA